MTATWLPPKTRIALVHDWLNQRGGAENVLEELHDLFGEPPVFTSLYKPDLMPDLMGQWDIHTSFLNRIPAAHALRRYLLPLYPFAFSHMDLSYLDLVFSVKSAFCLGVRNTGPDSQARHICYCLTPTRFLWNFQGYMQREQIPAPARFLIRRFIRHLRTWEIAAAQNVDEFVAISRTVEERIKACYGRTSVVIPPPVNTETFTPQASATTKGEYFLVVSRLIPYKRIDLAVAAFNQMPDKTLIIAGEGRAATEMRQMANSNIRFTGYLSQKEIVTLMRESKAFVFPGEEDFGITPVEAMSTGRPVIGFEAGGALDYVKDGVTGIFFQEQNPESLIEAVHRCEIQDWDKEALRSHALRFSVRNFRRRIREFVRTQLT